MKFYSWNNTKTFLRLNFTAKIFNYDRTLWQIKESLLQAITLLLKLIALNQFHSKVDKIGKVIAEILISAFSVNMATSE